MKKIVLLMSVTAILYTVIISESRADCTYKVNNACYTEWNPGKANNCGNGCTYDYNNGKLTVTATKADATIPKGFFSPYFYENGYFPEVNSIEINGEFAKIENNAFIGNSANISGKDGVLYLNGVSSNTFDGNTLTGSIIISDNQTRISAGHWYATTLDGTVILPPTINSVDGWATYGLHLGDNAEIYCGSENCKELFNIDSCNEISEQYQAACRANFATLMSSGKLHSYPDGCSNMNASGCSKCKNENFKLNDGECDRIRYTPAEAARYLKDADNMVIITFKINN